MNDIKFGVFLPLFALGLRIGRPLSLYKSVGDVTLECEKLGYHSVWVDDHLMFRNSPILECWTTLSALSATTKRIRLGTMVLCNSFRRPQVLAKMAATLDVISNGRLEFGIGAGVSEEEHVAYGVPFHRPVARLERMKEGVEIIKRMWTLERASYAGKHYTIEDAICEPKPLQKPHPPLVVGGGGEKLTLRIVAKYADRYDWGFLPSMKQYSHKLKVLEDHCSKVGRNFQEIEKSCWPGGQLFIAKDRKELKEIIAKWKPRNISLRDFEIGNLVGTPDKCIKRIQEWLNMGVKHFMLMFGDLPSRRGMRLFAKEVANKVKPS